ncbi:scavenger receptor cysteine-rich domain superfamily protein-like isoform X2 [Halichondria panicea]|uniref:scavenger receptor cysteine-rich domain superfamily protein-like isoform X2 n=1 Tax=Halichondria panicea TaxID=6063 RepID=UPI00312B3EEE
MQVTSLLLLAATTAIATAQPPECFNGQLRESNSNVLEYCYYGEWRLICHDDSQWNIDKTVAACTQLGYSDTRINVNHTRCESYPIKAVTFSDCNGSGLINCTVTPTDECGRFCSLVTSGQCNTANCTDGALRLVGGSTDREGRVEVCVGGRRWRTVCTGSQELAGAVCSQMGYIFEGSSVGVTNSFPPGAFLEYRLNCAQLSNGAWLYSLVKEQCDSFAELGVVCKNYKDQPDIQVITQLPTTSCAPQSKEYLGCICTNNSTTFTAGSGVLATLPQAVIAVLVVLQAATMVALISTCVVFKRKRKQNGWKLTN